LPEINTAGLDDLLLKAEIEDLLALECELLDERRFSEWLDLLADDVQYSMPMSRNVRHDALDQEYTQEGRDAMWFDEGKKELALRVEQLQSVDHWAEEPRSRTTHLVASIRLVERASEEVAVNSRFIVYRTRMERDVDLMAGKRSDRLRREGGLWKIARRRVLIDQSTLTSGNLTTFF
jgi:3-phenylpropionate/cinnamic acid dioxygenase small subunit